MKVNHSVSADNFIVDFSLPEDSKVRIELFNTSGQRLAVLYEGEANAHELNKITYPIRDVIGSGIIIYRLTTQQRTYYGKALITK